MGVKAYLKQGKPLLFDGAMGTYFAARPGRAAERCELANLEHPEEGSAIHRAYLEAGCRAIKTNTFSVGVDLAQGKHALARQIIAEGARLAACLQEQLIAGVDPENTRVPKSNMNYYMLKNASAPIVIVECGFLTNAAEEEKLGTVEYQRKLAWNIYLGTMHYMNGMGIQ